MASIAINRVARAAGRRCRTHCAGAPLYAARTPRPYLLLTIYNNSVFCMAHRFLLPVIYSCAVLPCAIAITHLPNTFHPYACHTVLENYCQHTHCPPSAGTLLLRCQCRRGHLPTFSPRSACCAYLPCCLAVCNRICRYLAWLPFLDSACFCRGRFVI